MSDSIQLNNTNSSNILQETEDGEIEDINSNSSEPNGNNKEIDEYYVKLKNLGTGLRCSCCEEVFSDPVKLNCDHLIDRSCLSNKLKSSIFICPVCQKNTQCEDIDDLLTDFDIAAQIPPKPNALIELINKNSDHISEFKRLPQNGIKEPDISDDGSGGYDLVNGVRIKREKSQKRRRKTRWSAIDESGAKMHNESSHHTADPQATFTGVISDLLASHNVPKNITISQFKKYTEISSKADVMNLLTEAVMQSARSDSQYLGEKKSHALTDKEILEMIPVQELEDLFELEKIQLVLLYREALDKGVLLLPSRNKSPVSSKHALLPTPKTSSKGSVKSHGKSSPTSSRKRYTSESSKSSNISYRSSLKSMLDSSDSESAGDIHHNQHHHHHRLHKQPKHRKCDPKLTVSSPLPTTVTTVATSIATGATNSHSSSRTTPLASAQPTIGTAVAPPPNVQSSQTPLVTSNISTSANTNCQNTPSSTSETVQVNSINSKAANDCQKICDNIRYREDINRLHALYSTMYHASLKMKDFENRVESDDYQSSYKTYCENYTEYQHLYSRLQSTINIDSIGADNPDPISNSYTNSCSAAATPLVNGINITVPAASQEQASSTISPAFYAPDSTDNSIIDNSKTVKPGAPYQHSNADLKANIQNNLSNYRQFKKENSLESKKKFGYLWVSNLSKEVRTSDLCKVFGKFGHISKVKLFQYKAQIPPTYFGLIFMPNYGEAETAVRKLHNKILNDKQIQIKMLCPNSDSINKTN